MYGKLLAASVLPVVHMILTLAQQVAKWKVVDQAHIQN